MAEPFVGEIQIKGVDATVADLRELEGQLGGVTESMESAGGGASNMGANITAAVVSVQAIYAGLTKMIGALKAAGDEFERQSGILNRFTGDITEASARTNGLISDLDLMTAQARATAAGLTLTGSEFATVSVRASEFAAATGQDATAALNTLVDAIATGRSGALLKYGVDLQGLTTVTEKQTASIAGLTEGYEEAESAADTLGGQIAVLETRFDNMQTEIIGTLNDTGLLDTAFESLGNTAEILFGQFDSLDDPDGPLSAVQLFTITGAAMFGAFAEELEETARQIAAVFAVIGDPGNMDKISDLEIAFTVAADSFGNRVERLQREAIGDMVLAELGRANAPTVTPPAARGRSGGRASASATAVTAPGDADNSLLEEIMAATALRVEQAEALAEHDDAKQAVMIAQNEAQKEALEMAREQKDLAVDMAEAAQKQIDAKKEEAKLVSRGLRAQKATMSGLQGIASITQKTIELTREGGMSTKEAFKTAVDEWLKQFAISEAWKAAAAFAEGIGNVVMNSGHAAAKFAEGAQHAALAVAAGGASAAIPNASASGGGSSGGEATRPSGGGQGGGSGGGNVVINYNAPIDSASLGRMQGRANRAASKRFDS